MLIAEKITAEPTEERLEVASYDPHLNSRLLSCISSSQELLREAFELGYKHWIVAFSGGKDSTTTLVVALEAALSLEGEIERIDVVYADTEIEIPSVYRYATGFLENLKELPRLASLPIHCHVVRPKLEESFWFCLLGKGYPPPHQKFRWCTRRLKIEPVEEALKTFCQTGKSVILTGVRFGESVSRDIRLLKSCSRGGECGQGAWLEYNSRLGVSYLAPIAHWQECDVWDFLQFHAPQLGYPTESLEESVYNGRGTRFGCWMCTVVRQDKAMEKITALPEWEHLKPLLEFRCRVQTIASSAENRSLRRDGRPGKILLPIRKALLVELLELQAKVGIQLISPEHVLAIRQQWEKEEVLAS